MYFRFDHKNLSMDVLVGIKEEYSPNPEAAALYDRTDALREKSNKFVKDTFGEIPMSEISKILDSDKDKKQEWDNFVNGEYLSELKSIMDGVKSLNEALQKKD